MDKKATPINYLGIFKDSWRITWKNRYLWWFGFFVALSGAGGGSSFNYSFNDESSHFYEKKGVMEFLSQNFHWIAIGVLALLILATIFVILGFLGRGALISSIEKHKAEKFSNFKLGLKKGKKYFWKIFLISLVIGLFVFSTLIVLIIPVVLLFLNHNYFIGALMMVMAGLILIPLIILSAYIKIYGYIYIALGKLSLFSSIESAYNLFRKNIGSSLIMALLFIPLNILLIIMIVAIIIPLAIVSLTTGFFVFLLAGKIGAIVVAVFAALVFLVALILIKSIYEVFAQSAWIFFFHKIAGLKEREKEEILESEIEPVPLAKSMPITESIKE